MVCVRAPMVWEERGSASATRRVRRTRLVLLSQPVLEQLQFLLKFGSFLCVHRRQLRTRWWSKSNRCRPLSAPCLPPLPALLLPSLRIRRAPFQPPFQSSNTRHSPLTTQSLPRGDVVQDCAAFFGICPPCRLLSPFPVGRGAEQNGWRALEDQGKRGGGGSAARGACARRGKGGSRLRSAESSTGGSFKDGSGLELTPVAFAQCVAICWSDSVQWAHRVLLALLLERFDHWGAQQLWSGSGEQ